MVEVARAHPGACTVGPRKAAFGQGGAGGRRKYVRVRRAALGQVLDLVRAGYEISHEMAGGASATHPTSSRPMKRSGTAGWSRPENPYKIPPQLTTFPLFLLITRAAN